MSGPHERGAASAERAIARHGRDITLIVPGAPTGSKRDPQPGAPTEIVVRALELEIASSEIDGSVIQGHDRRYLVAGSVAVTTAMRLRDDVPAAYEIVRTQPTQPGTTRLVTEILARL